MVYDKQKIKRDEAMGNEAIGRKAIILIAVLLSLTTFARTYNTRNGFTDSSLISSYDTTYVEKGDTFRQIYINDGKSEAYILIKNDSILLWDVDKIK